MVLVINPTAAQWTGWKIEEVQGRSLQEILPPDFLSLKKEKRFATKENGSDLLSIWEDFPAISTTGNTNIPVEVIQKSVYSDQGRLQGTLYLFRDVSSIQTLQQKMTERKIHFKQELNQMHSAVLIHDQEGQLIKVNQRACELFHYSYDQFSELSLSDIEYAFQPEQLQEWLQSASPGIPIPVKTIYRLKSGSSFPTEGVVGVCRTGKAPVFLQIFCSTFGRGLSKNTLHQITLEFKTIYTEIDQLLSEEDQMIKFLEV